MYITEILFVIGIVILMLAVIGILLICGKQDEKRQVEMVRLAIIRRNIWLKTSIIWMCLYYWLVLNSILTTLIVLYVSCYEDMNLRDMKVRVFAYSAISLFSSICPYIVNMLNVSLAYRSAYRLIDDAILSNENIVKMMQEGENIIADAHR